jgi:Leucine-rich repeat (LRR) protein
MFIKKDLRKIPRILADAALFEDERESTDVSAAKRVKRDRLTELKLARRKAEFQGSLSVLCQPSNSPSLKHLVSLSVYDCDIKSLHGIGFLGSAVDGCRDICCPALECLNVGRNPITTLPDELSMLSQSLKELWCDDCQIQGPLPPCVVTLDKLVTLHMANNNITEIPADISKLQHLKHLCLDNNKIDFVPINISFLKKLEVLLLRNNRISTLPDLPTNVRLLHISSNLLDRLPSSLILCTGLQQLCANSNKLKSIPFDIEALAGLKRLNLSNNLIEEIPSSFTARFGAPDKATGLCSCKDECVAYVGQNPFLMEYVASPDKRCSRAVLAD